MGITRINAYGVCRNSGDVEVGILTCGVIQITNLFGYFNFDNYTLFLRGTNTVAGWSGLIPIDSPESEVRAVYRSGEIQ